MRGSLGHLILIFALLLSTFYLTLNTSSSRPGGSAITVFLSSVMSWETSQKHPEKPTSHLCVGHLRTVHLDITCPAVAPQSLRESDLGRWVGTAVAALDPAQAWSKSWVKKRLCHKVVQPLWKAVGLFLRRWKIELLYDPAIPPLGKYPKEMKIGSQKEIFTPTSLQSCSRKLGLRK